MRKTVEAEAVAGTGRTRERPLYIYHLYSIIDSLGRIAVN